MECIDLQSKINLLDDQIENLERSGYFTDEEISSKTPAMKRLRQYYVKKAGFLIHDKYLLAVCHYCNGLRLCAREKDMSKEMNKEFLRLRGNGFVFHSISSNEYDVVIKSLHCKPGCENQHL